jgi:hypothetical protein
VQYSLLEVQTLDSMCFSEIIQRSGIQFLMPEIAILLKATLTKFWRQFFFLFEAKFMIPDEFKMGFC